LKTDEGVEYKSAFPPSLNNPPTIDLAMIKMAELPPEETPEVAVITPEKPTPPVEVEVTPKPTPRQASPVTKVVAGDTIRISGFRSSTSTALDEGMKAQLDEFVRYLKENPRSIVRLAGHSDDRGTLAQNMSRSRSRADAVKAYLMAQGIPEGRIYADARGSVRPIADNRSESGRRRNRRVDIVIEARR
jgi:outer membrane protein OmpA-like peptidoglycan-associated protein